MKVDEDRPCMSNADQDTGPAQHAILSGGADERIGHLEAGAGVASVMKAVLALKHRTIPPQLHLERLNPNILWDGLPIKVATEAEPWPHPDRLGRAGVSAFAASGKRNGL